jgi:hypothetical protein
MIRRNFYILAGIIILFSGFISCENDEFENETEISSYNSSESHNAGQNCMDCHNPGGSGESAFIIAGTVYDSTITSVYPNSTIKLYTSPNGTGTLKTTVQVDKYGNFYTTEYVDFEYGLYPSAEGELTTKYMSSAITTGQCNSCHGVSTDRIWTR